MQNLYIVGAGGCGREVYNIVREINSIRGQQWNIGGFLDDTEAPLDGLECDLPVVGSIVDYSPEKNDVLAMGVACPADKEMLATMLKGRGAAFATIIHPHTALGKFNKIGEGAIIYNGVGLTVNVEIGALVTMLGCTVGHDAVIGDYSTVSVGCHILGGTRMGKRVFLGAGSVVAPRINLADDTYVCMAAAVFKDTKTNSKMLGNPAKEIGTNL